MKQIITLVLSLFISTLLCAQNNIIAHRGYWNCETGGMAKNSLASLKAAGEKGFWGSEFDVNMTSDGVLLVYHDSSIDGKRIDQNPYSTFKSVKLVNGESIPTIEQYFKLAKKYPNTKLVIEIKSHSTPELENKCIESCIKKLKKAKLYDPKRALFISFSINACKTAVELAPGFDVQYLGSDSTPEDLAALGITGIDIQYKTLINNPDWIQRAKAKNMVVNTWTVNKIEDMKTMLELGVDFITTDQPEVLSTNH